MKPSHLFLSRTSSDPQLGTCGPGTCKLHLWKSHSAPPQPALPEGTSHRPSSKDGVGGPGDAGLSTVGSGPGSRGGSWGSSSGRPTSSLESVGPGRLSSLGSLSLRCSDKIQNTAASTPQGSGSAFLFALGLQSRADEHSSNTCSNADHCRGHLTRCAGQGALGLLSTTPPNDLRHSHQNWGMVRSASQ